MLSCNSHQICFARLISGIKSLGPGIRTCLWLQGCRHPFCKGCTSPELHPFLQERYISTDMIIQVLSNQSSDRLTISGGEPLDQAEALYTILRHIRCHYKDILLYTGYDFETLTDQQLRVVGMADVVITGPYQEFSDDGCVLKGSNNQHLYFTKRCKHHLALDYFTYVYTDQIEHTARRFSAWLPPIQCTLSGHQCMMIIQV